MKKWRREIAVYNDYMHYEFLSVLSFIGLALCVVAILISFHYMKEQIISEQSLTYIVVAISVVALSCSASAVVNIKRSRKAYRRYWEMLLSKHPEKK